MIINAKDIGQIIRQTRKAQRVTQKDLALSAGTGLRFISDLENGKQGCELGKVLMVIQTLGIKIQFQLPPVLNREQN